MDILDDMGVSKLSANVFFFKVNYSFNAIFFCCVAVLFQLVVCNFLTVLLLMSLSLKDEALMF